MPSLDINQLFYEFLWYTLFQYSSILNMNCCSFCCPGRGILFFFFFFFFFLMVISMAAEIFSCSDSCHWLEQDCNPFILQTIRLYNGLTFDLLDIINVTDIYGWYTLTYLTFHPSKVSYYVVMFLIMFKMFLVTFSKILFTCNSNLKKL